MFKAISHIIRKALGIKQKPAPVTFDSIHASSLRRQPVSLFAGRARRIGHDDMRPEHGGMYIETFNHPMLGGDSHDSSDSSTSSCD